MSRAPAPASPLTARAVAIGLTLAVALNLVMVYNDFYLRNTLFIGNHFPIVAIGLLLVLVLGVNVAARRLGREGLSQGELLLIWSMIGVAGSIGATGFWRYVPGWAASAAYYTTPSNDYRTYLLNQVPDWMLVSKNPDDPVIRWYFEGLPTGQAIPWRPWFVPMGAWLVFGLAMFAVMFALGSLFYRQWVDRERLIFAVTYLPVELTRPAAAGRWVNAFLSTPLVWIGAAIPILIHGWKGLRVYEPGLPDIPLSWVPSGIFPDRPWSEFDLQQANVFFSIIGITFLLTTEVSFSLWFLYVLYRLSFVFVAWLGAASTGYWGNWADQIDVLESAGGMFALAGFLFYTARRSLHGWLGRVVSGSSDTVDDLLPSRLTFALLTGGLAVMTGWLLAAGVAAWAACLTVALFTCVLLVLTRIVAEAGLFFVGSDASPYSVVAGLGPTSWLSGPTLAGLALMRGALMHDLREILLPFVMNGLKVADAVRAHLRTLLLIFAVTVVVAAAAAAYGRIATAYKYGGVNGDDWGHINSQADFLGALVTAEKNPRSYDWITIGGARVLPVTLAHVLTGAALTAGMLVLRARFLWWPIHPVGFIICGIWAMVLIWFSIFLGWLAKACVMAFGGATAYRRLLPFFLGLILGESLIACVWQVVSLLTGRPGLYILPN